MDLAVCFLLISSISRRFYRLILYLFRHDFHICFIRKSKPKQKVQAPEQISIDIKPRKNPTIKLGKPRSNHTEKMIQSLYGEKLKSPQKKRRDKMVEGMFRPK